MEIVKLPTLWKGEDNLLPVVMQRSDGSAVTGLAEDDVEVFYSRQSDVAMQEFEPTADQWDERGRGFYALTLPASLVNEEGMFCMDVTSDPTDEAVSGEIFRAIGGIDRRPEARILEAPVTGYASPQAGYNLENSVQHEVFVNPQYDAENEILDFTAWLHIGGQRVALPTDCQITVWKKEVGGDTLIADVTNSSPDANGVFYIQKTSLVLEENKNYEIMAMITYNGVVYTSVQGMQTLN